LALITIKDLLEARIHFGHKKSRWNPAMEPYIYGEKRGVHIIDIRKTMHLLNDAYFFARDASAEGKKFILVGTKKQASEIIEEAAKKTESFYVNQRWLGGTLTNFNTIKKSIDKYNELEKMFSMQSFQNYTKKEIIMMKRKMEKMKKYFEGIKDMKELPDIMYIIDIKKEINAVREANLTNIPVIGVVDTNSNPTMVTYPIPANDDAIESIQLITNVISTAIAEGKKLYIDRAKKSKVEKKEPPKKKEKKNES